MDRKRPKAQRGQHENPHVADLLDVSQSTFDILWHIVWEEYMTAKAELSGAKYEHDLQPDKEATAINLAVAEDIFAHTQARLTFLNDWELANPENPE